MARLRTFEATCLNQSLLDPFYCWILVLCLEMKYLHTEWPKKLQNNIQLKCHLWEPFYFSIEAHSENFELMSPRYPKKACSDYHISLCHKGNGSYVIKDFGTLPLIFSTSKYFRKFQHCPWFFLHLNIPDKLKRGQLSLEKVTTKEKVKVES